MSASTGNTSTSTGAASPDTQRLELIGQAAAAVAEVIVHAAAASQIEAKAGQAGVLVQASIPQGFPRQQLTVKHLHRLCPAHSQASLEALPAHSQALQRPCPACARELRAARSMHFHRRILVAQMHLLITSLPTHVPPTLALPTPVCWPFTLDLRGRRWVRTSRHFLRMSHVAHACVCVHVVCPLPSWCSCHSCCKVLYHTPAFTQGTAASSTQPSTC